MYDYPKSVVTNIILLILEYEYELYMFYNVVTMFIDDSTYTRNGKTYRRVLLRNSYRSHGKVRISRVE